MKADPGDGEASAPLDHLAEALMGLHRLNQIRDSMLGRLNPGSLLQHLKAAPGELGDSLFRVARAELDALDRVIKGAYRQVDRLSKAAPLLARRMRLFVSLAGRLGEEITGSTDFLNWRGHDVIPRLRPGSFMTRDGSKRVSAIPAFDFTPDGPIAGGNFCTLGIALRLEPGGGFAPGIYFQEVEILAESERLALLTIQLEITGGE